MKRRAFIWLSIAGATAVSVPFAIYNLTPSAKQMLATPSSLSRLFGHKQIQKIGDMYRKLTPDEANETVLMKRLLNDNEALTLTESTASQLHTLLNQKISTDFKNNQMQVLDGWIVSRTEARQCALFSILNA